jgi:hypothetical protein
MYDAFAPLYTITIHFPQCSAQLELELQHSTPPAAQQRHRIGAFALWLQVTKITIQNLPPNDLLITLYYISRYLYTCWLGIYQGYSIVNRVVFCRR